MISTTLIIVTAVSLALGGHYSGLWSIPSYHSSSSEDVRRWECHPFLPPLFVETPPSASHPSIQAASDALHRHLTKRFSQGDIDSLSVAVITSQGALYEQNFGVMRANESNSLPTTSHSMYRIASISKLFTVLEGFILEQKSRLSWCAFCCHEFMAHSAKHIILGTTV
jgi:CubicO group peptidase (beta-lactamase class C family)